MNDYLSQKIRVLSLFAIIAVVYVHAYNLTDRYLVPFTISQDPLSPTSFIEMFVSNGLTRFAVPIFFLISGYLFFHKFRGKVEWFLVQFVKRLRSLALPYLLWSAIGLFLIWAFQQTDTLRPAVDTWDILPPEISLNLVFYRWLGNPVPYQLWFVRDLLLYALLSPILYASLRYLRIAPLILIGGLWLFHTNFVIMEAEGILFFMIGAYFAIHRVPVPTHAPAWIPISSGAIWLIFLTIKTLLAFAPTPPIALILLHKLVILIGVVAVWSGYDIAGESLNENPGLANAAPFATFIYFAHEPLLNFLSNYALRQWDSISPLAVYLTYPLLTVALCLFSGIALRTFIPLIYGLLTGGRGTE